MNGTLTLCDFLEQSGYQTTFFDMGRRVVELPLDIMRRFEQTDLPYPFPFQRYAWLGILLMPTEQIKAQQRDIGNADNHSIWFIKLPLDEQGLLKQAARDDFLQRVLQALDDSKAINSEPATEPDNPYGFTPREERMAMFHAKISRQLDESPSQFYRHACDYFSGATGYDQWNFVGLQGIADVVTRLDEDNHAEILARAIPNIPPTPFAALCSCLENQTVDKQLTRVIAARIYKALNEGNPLEVAAGIRGLSNSADRTTVNAVLDSVLTAPVGNHVEVLAAIAGRAWKTLEDASVRMDFLEALARCEAGQQAFNGLLSDLLFIPGLGQIIRQEFRNPQRSEQLAMAISAFLKSVQASSNTHST